jgi:hypothetical protein
MQIDLPRMRLASFRPQKALSGEGEVVEVCVFLQKLQRCTSTWCNKVAHWGDSENNNTHGLATTNPDLAAYSKRGLIKSSARLCCNLTRGRYSTGKAQSTGLNSSTAVSTGSIRRMTKRHLIKMSLILIQISKNEEALDHDQLTDTQIERSGKD